MDFLECVWEHLTTPSEGSREVMGSLLQGAVAAVLVIILLFILVVAFPPLVEMALN